MSDSSLPRQFGFWTATLVTVASMVGVGILTTSGYIIRSTESPSTLMLLWIIGGVVSLAGALTFAELATLLPHAGGDYVFVRRAYGDGVGFMYGWATLLLGFAGPTAVIAHALVVYGLLPLRASWIADGGTWPEWITPTVASIVILVLTLVHCRGQRSSSWLQNATTLLKVTLLSTFVIAGLFAGHGDWQHFSQGRPLADQSVPVAVSSLVYVFYGYSGWNASAYIAGEVQNTSKTLPRAILAGCGLVTLLYLIINVVYVYAIGPIGLEDADMQQVEAIAETAARALFGPVISEPLSVLIGLTILASVSAYVLTGSRICYAMACDNLFPAYARQISTSHQTPVAAVLTMGFASVTLLWGSYLIAGAADAFASLLNFTTVGLVLLTSLAVSSVFVHRRRAERSDGYSMPWYPLPPIFFLLSTGVLMAFAFMQSPGPTLWGTLAVLSGGPVYWLLKKR
ncbi:MAG: amino acid permease [Planctomycetaceae bacterium]